MDSKPLFLKQETVKKIFTQCFKKPKTTIHPEALEHITKAINIAVMECCIRAGRQAFSEDSSTVTSENVLKILPQLMLDI